jgi:acetyl esterase/lipase
LKNKIILAVLLCLTLDVGAQPVPTAKDLAYAEINGNKLLLDIYMPAPANNPYLIVWIHGGAWRSGSKENPPLGLLASGYAIASVNYRLTGEAPFPALIHDIKAAVRFLRGNAKQYGYRSDKIAIWGSSAGGHLAALVGTTNGDTQLEGELGNFRNESSSVQLVIDYYGPTNFTTILAQSTPHGISVRVPALTQLLGRPVEQVPALAKQASPVFQVDASDPPMLIVHGDQDNQVPVNQSLELMAAYKKFNLPVQIEFVPGAGHTDNIYYQKDIERITQGFLQRYFLR